MFLTSLQSSIFKFLTWNLVVKSQGNMTLASQLTKLFKNKSVIEIVER